MSTISSSTTSTTAYKVTADTTGTLVIQTGATPTTAVTVDASQNVGIGTSSPSDKLNIVTSAVNGGITISGSTDPQYYLSSSGGNTARFKINDAGAGAMFGSWSNMPATIHTNGTERMRIDSSGNVGIGTSSPGYKLDVQSSASSGAPLMANFQSAGGDPQLYISNGTVKTQLTADATNSASIVGSFSNHPLIIRTNNAEVGRFDSAGLFKFNSGYGSAATAYGCRAWVNFNGTGTVAIRASANVTSITDNGVGDYTVNFTNAMPDGNYAYHIGSKQDQAGVGDAAFPTNGTPTGVTDGAAGMTTTRIRLRFVNLDGTTSLRDQEVVCVSIFR